MNREALSDLTERPDPAKIDALVDYARAGGLEPHDEGNGMDVLGHGDDDNVGDWTLEQWRENATYWRDLAIDYQKRLVGADARERRLEGAVGAIDAAYAALNGSQYVGGPTEREAFRTAMEKLWPFVTQHTAQGGQ